MMDVGLQAFIDESRELLVEMESGLLQCERNVGGSETINSIFRVAHTIKGSSGLFGLDAIVSFVHVVETALDRVRIGDVGMNREFAVLLLSCKDHIEALVAATAAGGDLSNPDFESRSAELSLLLQEYAGAVKSHGGAKSAPVPQAPTGSAPTAMIATSDTAATDRWHISARFKADVLRAGMDPLAFIRYLNTFGKVQSAHVVADALPTLGDVDPETCYLGFELSFKTDADEARIRSAFEFVSEDCTLAVLPPRSSIDTYLRTMPEFATDPGRAGEILVRSGTLTQAESERALANARPAQNSALPSESAEPAARKASQAAEASMRASSGERSIRVDASKLDHLITLVGELIIASASANLSARRAQNVDLQERTSRLADLVESVRDSALQLRMVKIGPTFNRFQRVVNDVARELGKDIELVVSGEDTELDKTVVEKIADPLTHLVRNAIDHGIEPADLRAARNKPRTGTITIPAASSSK